MGSGDLSRGEFMGWGRAVRNNAAAAARIAAASQA